MRKNNSNFYSMRHAGTNCNYHFHCKLQSKSYTIWICWRITLLKGSTSRLLYIEAWLKMTTFHFYWEVLEAFIFSNISSITNASFSEWASAYDPVSQAYLPQLEASVMNFMQAKSLSFETHTQTKAMKKHIHHHFARVQLQWHRDNGNFWQQ